MRFASRLPNLLPLALVMAVGVLVGLGGYTFVYARGYSYLSDDPLACVNCHIMRDNYKSWSVSSHRSVTCNDCHTPHQLAEKYLVKAEHGFAHSWAFTFGDPQVIQIKSRSLEVVEHNCASCHEPTITSTFLVATSEDPTCTRCHAGAGHPPQ